MPLTQRGSLSLCPRRLAPKGFLHPAQIPFTRIYLLARA